MSERSKRINKMFSKISSSYDLMNRLLSLGIDESWRAAAIEKVAKLNRVRKPQILDIATGTGDLAFMLEQRFRSARIIGMDFNEPMLKIARQKQGDVQRIKFEKGDALHLKYGAESMDVVTSGFALRNLDNLQSFSREMYRVLKPGGVFVLLDMARPDDKGQSAFFDLYSVYMRTVGTFVDPEAYEWLVDTINRFDKKKLMAILKKQDFKNLEMKQLSTGVAYIACGRKPSH